MALVKITFDGSSVSARQDADINYHLTGLVSAGIIKGLGSELSYSISNNYITFQDGYVQIYGRRIYVEAGSQVHVSLDSTKYGYVIITINLSSNTVTLGIAETTSPSYPTLTQQNLHKSGTIYQFPICKYSKTTTSLNVDSSFKRNYIETPLSVAQSCYNDSINYMDRRLSAYAIQAFNKYKVQLPLTEDQDYNLKKTLFIVKLKTSLVIPVPGFHIPEGGFSTVNQEYEIKGITYLMTLEVYQQQLYITMGDSSHLINYVFAYR